MNAAAPISRSLLCLVVVFLIDLASCRGPAHSEGAARHAASVPVYGTFDLVLTESGISGNPFLTFASARFAQDGREFEVDGFFDGDGQWRVRFMPDRAGRWSYAWSLGDRSGQGSFQAVPQTDPRVHGHVRRDPDRPRYLRYDDGTPHYWFGGKWFRAENYGPEGKQGQFNRYRLDDATILRYLNLLEEERHNGILVKMALFPLEDDGISWDLDWIRRAEWLVREAGKRGIYCHINIFDTWSRGRGTWFGLETDGRRQVFDVWSEGDEAAKRNYIRTLVARFAGFYNVYWELGNEMEHAPNDGAAFVRQANARYIPWLRRYDPYDVPIGLSEGIWRQTAADIGFLHQANAFSDAAWKRPTIMNELVRGGPTGPLWRHEVMSDPRSRLAYRRAFWGMFIHGGSGASEASWLDIEEMNDDVRAVMEDHRRLRDFLEALPVPVVETNPVEWFVLDGPVAHRTRGKPGVAYVTYFHDPAGGTVPGGTIRVSLDAGNYQVAWYDPATGASTGPIPVASDGSEAVSLHHPAFSEDVVLRITATGPPSIAELPEP